MYTYRFCKNHTVENQKQKYAERFHDHSTLSEICYTLWSENTKFLRSGIPSSKSNWRLKYFVVHLTYYELPYKGMLYLIIL